MIEGSSTVLGTGLGTCAAGHPAELAVPAAAVSEADARLAEDMLTEMGPVAPALDPPTAMLAVLNT